MNRLARLTGLAFVAGLPLYLLLFLFADRPVALWLHANHPAGIVHVTGEEISAVAGGQPVTMAITAAFVLALALAAGKKENASRTLLYVCATVALALLLSDTLKYTLARYRPVMLFEHGLYGLHWLSDKWEQNSTPSGHTTRAFAVCVALALLWRRWWPSFLLPALAVGLARIAVTDHYPSDVLFGAFVGSFSALWMHALIFRNAATEGRPDKA